MEGNSFLPQFLFFLKLWMAEVASGTGRCWEIGDLCYSPGVASNLLFTFGQFT